jgi:formate-dependent nitrite reductase cytochrome c552 subunit
MKAAANKSLVLTGITVVFFGLAAAFFFELWGRPVALAPIPPTAPDFTNTATVRMSAAELVRTGGDTSGMACYSCHDEKKPVVVHLDTNGTVILPEAHHDLVLKHGRSNRNDHCFNCHDQKNLELLRSRDGTAFKLTESSRLCGSCHGPTYRDWEAGIHGRTSGFWDRKRGEVVRQDCTDCHDPHAPAFPSMKPGPGPNVLHPKTPASRPTEKGAH